MTVEDRGTFRAVILPTDDGPSSDRAQQLLNDLGHEVSPARSPDHARRLLEDGETDLLIVDVSNSSANKNFVQQLGDLPESSRPRELAIFSDWIDESFSGLRHRVTPSHVHVFLKPLHIHGLLSVLRQLDNSEVVADA